MTVVVVDDLGGLVDLHEVTLHARLAVGHRRTEGASVRVETDGRRRLGSLVPANRYILT